MFGSTKLPSNHEVLGAFFCLHNKEKKTIRETSTETVRQVQAIWMENTRIPVKPEQHSIKKLENSVPNMAKLEASPEQEDSNANLQAGCIQR